MDNTLALIIGAVVALVVFAIVIGKRLASARIRLGKHIKGHHSKIEATGDGAPISNRMSKDDDPYS